MEHPLHTSPSIIEEFNGQSKENTAKKFSCMLIFCSFLEVIMVKAINFNLNSQFFEGTRLTGCAQKLSDLIVSIKKFVIGIFQRICPCFFSKAMAKISPMTTATAVPQKNGGGQITPPITNQQAEGQPSIQQLSRRLSFEAIQRHQQNAGSSSSSEANSDNDDLPPSPVSNAAKQRRIQTDVLTQVRRQSLGNTSVGLPNCYLNPELVPGEHITGTLCVRPKEGDTGRMAIYTLVEALKVLITGTKLDVLKPDDLDAYIRMGARSEVFDKDGRKLKGLALLQHLQKSNNGHFARGDTFKINQTYSAQEILDVLSFNASTKGLGGETQGRFMCMLVNAMSGADASPPVYLLSLQYSVNTQGEGVSDLFLLDPAGGSSRPICMHKLNKEELIKYLDTKLGYFCFGIQKATKA